MAKIINILGLKKKVVIYRFDHGKTRNCIIMEPISEKEEDRIDKSASYFGATRHVLENGHVVDKRDVYMYGKIDLENEEDINIIKQKNIVDLSLTESWVYTDIDFNTGNVIANNGKFLKYPTADPLLWFKFNHLLLGKPERVIIYRMML